MKRIKKTILFGTLLGCIWLVSGCEEASETVKKVTDDVSEVVQVEATKENEFLLSVKGGHLQSYPDIKIEDAFAIFFSSPKWKYFEAETGEHVVEFTGYCTYMEKKVKAKLQFIVEEGSNTFEVGALEFNEVPQNELIKAALISAIYEGNGTNTESASTNSSATNDAPVASVNGITAEEAVNLSKRLPSYSDLVANGDTFLEPRIYDGLWIINVSRPSGTAEGSIIIDENRTVSFMYPNGEVDEVTPYTETEQNNTQHNQGKSVASENGFLSEDEIFDIAWQHPVASYIDSPSIEVNFIYYPTEEIPFYMVQVGDFSINTYYSLTIDAYSGEVIDIASE